MTAWVLVVAFMVHGGYAPLTVPGIASEADCQVLAKRIIAQYHREINGTVCYDYAAFVPEIRRD